MLPAVMTESWSYVNYKKTGTTQEARIGKNVTDKKKTKIWKSCFNSKLQRYKEKNNIKM